MIKNFLLSSLLLLSIAGFSQQGTSSPYSYYGIGDLKFNGTVDTRAMGGLGILPDSIHANLQNPATLSSLKLTNYILGGTYNTNSIKNSSTSEKARTTSLDYMGLAFPVGKFGFSFGLMPYSAVGYRIRITDATSNSDYTGSGNLNKAFLSTGYQITSKWSVGAEFGYQFGRKETNATVFLTDPLAAYGTREVNSSEYNGVRYNVGSIYKAKFKKYDIISSVTFSPSSILKSNNVRDILKVQDVNGNAFAVDIRSINVPDSDLRLPSKLAFGSGIGVITKWFVGFESTFQQSRDFPVQISPTAVASYQEATKFVLGGYYVPNYKSFNSYYNKITYRAGLRYENTGLLINGQSITDTAFTFGFGLPFYGGYGSNVNLGFELGKKGTTDSNLIQENYFNVSVGFSFNDKWFVKRKFD